MLVKVRQGTFDPEGGDVEPGGDELWAGGHKDLSAAALANPERKLELGTWYPLDEFETMLGEIADIDGEVRSAVTICQPGVDRPWSAAIEVDEASAALMLCRSVVDHARQLAGAVALWVRVE